MSVADIILISLIALLLLRSIKALWRGIQGVCEGCGQKRSCPAHSISPFSKNQPTSCPVTQTMLADASRALERKAHSSHNKPCACHM